VLTAEELESRSQLLEESADLQALATALGRRVAVMVKRDPQIPRLKGMLTADGGSCPVDGAPLLFDPWSPSVHKCSRCGAEARGERHDQRWAWHQHLWLAERIAEAATLGVLTNNSEASDWAVRKLEEYAERYFELPNRDNVLGPTHLFSSTYLESIWLTNYLAAAYILREAEGLSEPTIDAVSRVADEAGNLIGEFDERLSNRQTWHNAALAAAAVWFGDEDLATRAIQGPEGLVGHLVDGFGPDGMWYEGENYHLFALRGVLVGAWWARLAGVELFAEAAGQRRLIAALRAPILTALPDGSFPARKDSRFGVSLAQPMYLELWEAGLAFLDDSETAAIADVSGWLAARYDDAAPLPQLFDSYLHEAGEPVPAKRSRANLSSWMLLVMRPELPASDPDARTLSVLLPEQGLAVLRGKEHYASLECGAYGGGHGHPDRLHLSLFANGVHWLADPGTGTYVSRDLFWYRSTLAHNAPRLDGRSQHMEDADCLAFDQGERWGWVKGAVGKLTRTVVVGDGHLLDIVEYSADDAKLVELPWHPHSKLGVLTPGKWESASLDAELVDNVQRFVPEQKGEIRIRAVPLRSDGEHALELIFLGEDELLRASGPGRPGSGERQNFLVRRQEGRYVRLISVLRWGGPPVTAVRTAGSEIIVELDAGRIVHRPTPEGWEVEQEGKREHLKGTRRNILRKLSLDTATGPLTGFIPPVATAPRLEPPPLDGSLDGFPHDPSIEFDHDDQYRRSELPYEGAEAFSARGYLGWDDSALYVGIEVIHPEPVFPAAGSAALKLDNEPDLIHADGIQVYLKRGREATQGWLIVPDPDNDALQVRSVSDTDSDPSRVEGKWMRTEEGYTISLAIRQEDWPPAPNEETRFDLLVNRMESDRRRRAGQLVWSGGGGWVYLRGDRQSLERFGRIEFA
jgi:hypothetical protein